MLEQLFTIPEISSGRELRFWIGVSGGADDVLAFCGGVEGGNRSVWIWDVKPRQDEHNPRSVTWLLRFVDRIGSLPGL